MEQTQVDLTELPTAALEQWNSQLDEEGAVIRAQRLAIVAELNTRAAADKAKKTVANLTPLERAAVLEVLTAEGETK